MPYMPLTRVEEEIESAQSHMDSGNKYDDMQKLYNERQAKLQEMLKQ